MVENSKIGRIIFFRIRSSTGYKISENLDRISARRKLCGDSVPCIIWTDALECMDCRTGMWNCISHDIEMVTGGNRVRRQLDDPEYGYFSRDLESAWNADACISCGCDGSRSRPLERKMETDDKNVVLSFSSDRLSGDIYMVKLKGSTVVEMAYLMPVVLLCWMAVIFALFYYHDKNIIGGAAYETAIVGSEEWRWQKEIEDGKMEQYFQKRIENKLIFFDAVSVETAVVKDEFEVTAGAQKRKMRVSVKRSAALTVPEEKIRRKKSIAGDCRKGPGGMREEYERDLHHAWMILETDELYKEDYQMRMLMENAIPGLLSVRGQGKDDKSQYRYEISGKISVKAKGEKEHWKFADLENFMRQFIQVLYAVKNYLLNVNCLSLDSGHIYVSDEIYYFCYCPGLEGNILEKFHELTEYFVRETDYEQKEAVYLAYELHKASMEENYNIEYALERILEKKENEMESIQPEKKAGYDLQEELILDDWIAEQEMKGQVVKDRQSVWGFLNQRLQKRRKKRESQWDEIMADDSEE